MANLYNALLQSVFLININLNLQINMFRNKMENGKRKNEISRTEETRESIFTSKTSNNFYKTSTGTPIYQNQDYEKKCVGT